MGSSILNTNMKSTIIGLTFLTATVCYAGLAGGLTETAVSDLNEADYNQAMEFAEMANNQHFTGSSDPVLDDNSEIAQLLGSFQVRKLIKYSTQIVSGVNYHIEYVICDGTYESAQKCKAVIFNQPWTDTLEVSSVECEKLVW